MDAPEARRGAGRPASAEPRRPALAGGRVPSPLRRLAAAVTLLTLLPVSYFVASLAIPGPAGPAAPWNVPLLVASVLIGAVAMATARALTDRRPVSPWLATATLLPAVATLHSTGLV